MAFEIYKAIVVLTGKATKHRLKRYQNGPVLHLLGKLNTTVLKVILIKPKGYVPIFDNVLFNYSLLLSILRICTELFDTLRGLGFKGSQSAFFLTCLIATIYL